MNKTFEEVEEMCIDGTVKYLAPGGTFHLPRDGQHWKTTHERVSKLEGVKWVAWSGDPLAQYTFEIKSETP